jgi:hypothetical protein
MGRAFSVRIEPLIREGCFFIFKISAGNASALNFKKAMPLTDLVAGIAFCHIFRKH